ncbi:MAG: hypothetical protein J6Y25_02060 [Elusimicrobiaceae bacterium]|nr:hypothetical protein [Elusimicrobiaceae bacterium]MBP5616498.1 hypothetical protein [Elusimicrobiaceae bacterium]
MKVEIKKVSIKDVLFSAFPLAVFVVMLLTAVFEVFKPEATLTVSYVMGLVMYAISATILFLVSSVVLLFAYNFLCSLGVRGVRVDLEDK